MLAGGEPKSVRSVARFILLGPVTTRRPARSTTPLARRRASPGAQHKPRRQAVRCARREPACRGPVVARVPHPIHLRHAEAVRVETAGDRHQPRHRPRHHTVGGAERLQGQQLAVHDGGEHRRGHRRVAAGDDVGQQLQPAADLRRRRAVGPAGRRRSGPRPPARAAGRSLAAGPAARRRPTTSPRPPAPPKPAAHPPAPGRAHRSRTAAASRRRAPRMPAPPAARPRPPSPAIRADSCDGDAPGPAPRGPLRRPPPRRAARPTGPADRPVVTAAHASRPLAARARRRRHAAHSAVTSPTSAATFGDYAHRYVRRRTPKFRPPTRRPTNSPRRPTQPRSCTARPNRTGWRSGRSRPTGCPGTRRSTRSWTGRRRRSPSGSSAASSTSPTTASTATSRRATATGSRSAGRASPPATAAS